MTHDGVSVAFNIIQEELENATKSLNNEGAQAFQAGEYDKATGLSQMGKDLAQFRTKVLELEEEWTRHFDIATRGRVHIELVEEQVFPSRPISENKPRRITHVRQVRNPRTNIRVTFPDDCTIFNQFAANTLAESIEKLGVEKVKALNLIVNGHPLISSEKHNRYGQIKVGDYYVMTSTSTQVKKHLLKKIARALDVRLFVEVV